MKILYCLTAYPPSTGGAQTHFYEIARRLAQRHHVEVVCHWRENRTDWLRGVTVDAPGDAESISEKIPIRQINLSPSDRQKLAPWVWTYYLTMGVSVRRISCALFEKLDKQIGDIDVVHAGRIGREFLAWAAFKLARRRNVPFIFTPFHHPKWSGWRWRWYTKLYREADVLLALTHAEKDQLIRLGVAPGRVRVVGHAPVLSQVRPRSGYFGPGGPVVLFLGQKYAYKGLHQILASMPLVWQRRPDTRFAFIGPRTRYSQSEFRSWRDPRVVEKDRVPENEKVSALDDCAIFCLPSRQESFGGVFLEAWLRSKPVIGGNIPAVAEIIRPGENGELVDASPCRLAEAILKFLDRPDYATACGRQGKALTLREYTWDKVVGRVEEAYQQVFQSTSHGFRPSTAKIGKHGNDR